MDQLRGILVCVKSLLYWYSVDVPREHILLSIHDVVIVTDFYSRIRIVLHRQVWLLLLLPITLTILDIRLFNNPDISILKESNHRNMYHMSFDELIKQTKDQSKADESIRLL